MICDGSLQKIKIGISSVCKAAFLGEVLDFGGQAGIILSMR